MKQFIFLNTNNLPGILLAVDYRRAFESVSKDFINWAFQRFGFGQSFFRWVRVLTANTESCINCMGWLSEPIRVESGINLVRVSILSNGLHSRPRAAGIENKIDPYHQRIKLPDFSNEENTVNIILKLVLYADDATLFLRDKNDLQCVLLLTG